MIQAKNNVTILSNPDSASMADPGPRILSTHSDWQEN